MQNVSKINQNFRPKKTVNGKVADQRGIHAHVPGDGKKIKKSVKLLTILKWHAMVLACNLILQYQVQPAVIPQTVGWRGNQVRILDDPVTVNRECRSVIPLHYPGNLCEKGSRHDDLWARKPAWCWYGDSYPGSRVIDCTVYLFPAILLPVCKRIFSCHRTLWFSLMQKLTYIRTSDHKDLCLNQGGEVTWKTKW